MISPFGLDFLLDPDSAYDDFLIAGDWWEENGPEGGYESFFFRTLSKWERRPTRHGLFHRLPSHDSLVQSEPVGRCHYLPKEFYPLIGSLPVSLGDTITDAANWFIGGYWRFVLSLDYAAATFRSLDRSLPGPPDWSFFWDAEDAAIWPSNREDAEALRELGRRRYTPILSPFVPNERYCWMSWVRPSRERQLPLTFFSTEERGFLGRGGERYCSPSMILSECYRWYLRRYHEQHKPALLRQESPA